MKSGAKTIKKPKVVFTFVEAGMGHITPMKSICAAFEEKYGKRIEVVKLYPFRDSKYEQVRKMGIEQEAHVKRLAKSKVYKNLEAFTYRFPSKLVLRFLDLHFRKAFRLIFEEFKELAPDLMVSSYYLPSHLMRLSNEKGYTNSLIATYTPDTYVYPAWDRRCDAFIVNNKRAYEHAIKGGFKEKIIWKIPYIFRQGVVGESAEKTAMHKKLGIEERFTILFTSGAYGSKGVEKLIKKLLQTKLDINFIVVCGKNQEFLERVKNYAKTKSDSVNLIALGFVDNLPQYMSCADLILGKSSLNTIMEARYLGKPIMLCEASNANEADVYKYCKKTKLAICGKNPKKALKFIESVVKGKLDIEKEISDFAPLKDESGAEQCADLLYLLLRKKFGEI